MQETMHADDGKYVTTTLDRETFFYTSFSQILYVWLTFPGITFCSTSIELFLPPIMGGD
jgi:hypothetical protein